MQRAGATGTAGAATGQIAVYAAAGGALVLWSGTAIANKIAVGAMDAMTAGVLRSMLAGLIAAAVAAALRFPLPRGAGDRVLLVVSGVASFAAWPALFSLGLGRTSASHAALIMATIPVFTGLIAAAFERRWPWAGWWLGVAIALCGTAFLVFYRSGGALIAADAGIAGDLIVLGGAAICALGYVAGGRISPKIGTWATTFWGLAAATVVLVPGFIALAPRTDWSAVGQTGWLAIAYLTLMSSLAGYAAWFWALGHGGIARIGASQLAMPVMTVALAALILGEKLTAPLMIAAAVIICGTALTQRSPKRELTAAARAD